MPQGLKAHKKLVVKLKSTNTVTRKGQRVIPPKKPKAQQIAKRKNDLSKNHRKVVESDLAQKIFKENQKLRILKIDKKA